MWKIGGGRTVSLDQARVMAILNVTPDSFFDGGRFGTAGEVGEAAVRAAAEGADLLDIGGESTRPGAMRVSVAEQVERLVPAIRAIREAGVELPVSVDTTHGAVIREILNSCGSDSVQIINDVSGGEEDPELFSLACEMGLGLVLMHRLREPGEDSYSDAYREAPVYEDVVEDVRRYLESRVKAAKRIGVDERSILVDPGLGFGKTVEQNLALIRGTEAFCGLGAGVMSGLSRKSFVGRVFSGGASDPGDRLPGSIVGSICHYLKGARVFRVHDVAQQRASLDLAGSILGQVGLKVRGE